MDSHSTGDTWRHKQAICVKTNKHKVICVAQAEHPPKRKEFLWKMEPSWIQAFGLTGGSLRENWLFLGLTLKINMSPVEWRAGISPYGWKAFFPPLVASRKGTNQQQRCWQLPSHACKTQRGTALGVFSPSIVETELFSEAIGAIWKHLPVALASCF